MFRTKRQGQEEELQQFEQADYLPDAVRFNAFALSTQQKQQLVILQPFISFFNIVAIIFESFLHVNLGRDYVNPIALVVEFLRDIMDGGGLVIGLFIVGLAGFAVFLDANGHLGSLSGFFDALYNFVLSGFLIWFFVVGFVAMTAQAVYSFLTYHARDNKRFSFSNGTPWIYYLTRLPFLKSLKYILYVEPLMLVLAGWVLHLVGWADGKYLALFACFYLLRNIHVYFIIDKGDVQRTDMAIKSAAEMAHQAEAQPVMQQASMKSTPSPSQADEIKDFEN